MRTEVKDLSNGLKQVTEFFDDGKVYHKWQTLNGERHGEETLYYKSGQIKIEFNWVNGKFHGEEVWYYENGKIELKRNWDNYVLIEEIKYNKDGSIKGEI